jgi:hypothetical protein
MGTAAAAGAVFPLPRGTGPGQVKHAIDPRVGVKRAPAYPEIEDLNQSAQWRLLSLVNERQTAGRNASRALRLAVIGIVWLVGLIMTYEVMLDAFYSQSTGAGCVMAPMCLAGTAGLAWASSAWMRRIWTRIKLADLRESRGCYRCDYPLATDAGEEPMCPECGLTNDLRERTWWRIRGREVAVAAPSNDRESASPAPNRAGE